MAIGLGNTLGFVAPQTKSVDAELRRTFGEKLRRWVDERHDGNQSAAGRELGVSQSHISATISGKRGVGLHFLLIFAAASDLSLDDLLGMTKGGAEEERIRRLLREELAAIRDSVDMKEEPAHEKPVHRRHARRRGLLE